MTLLLKNLLFTCVVPGTVAGFVPWLLVRSQTPGSGSARLAAWVLYAVGLAIYAWCVWDFATFGRGTPAPIDAPKRLVVRGLYHWTRNPMYVGVLSVILAWATRFGSTGVLAYAAGVFACFHTFVVVYEEPHLAGEFGAEYERYRREVGRWLPRLVRRSPGGGQ